MEIKALEMTREIREQIYRDTQGMSRLERREYMQARARAFRAWLKKARQEDARATQANERRAGGHQGGQAAPRAAAS